MLRLPCWRKRQARGLRRPTFSREKVGKERIRGGAFDAPPLMYLSIMPLFSACVYSPMYSVTNVQSSEGTCFYTCESLLLLRFIRRWLWFILLLAVVCALLVVIYTLLLRHSRVGNRAREEFAFRQGTKTQHSLGEYKFECKFLERIVCYWVPE